MWNQGNTPPLPAGVQICIATLEISMKVSQKIGNQSTTRSSNTTLGHIPKGYSNIPQKHLLNNVHSSIIRHSQNLDVPQLRCPLTEEQINKALHYGILLSCKKKMYGTRKKKHLE